MYVVFDLRCTGYQFEEIVSSEAEAIRLASTISHGDYLTVGAFMDMVALTLADVSA